MSNAPIPYPFPYFAGFMFSPTLPAFYTDTYSAEQTILNLCKNYCKLVAFCDALVDTVNSQYEVVESIESQIEETVEDIIDTQLSDPTSALRVAIDAKIDEYLESVLKGTTYAQLNTNGFLYSEE